MYNVSKAATIHLNTLLAQELSQPGVSIRVNSIAPGIFPSQMTSERHLAICIEYHPDCNAFSESQRRDQ